MKTAFNFEFDHEEEFEARVFAKKMSSQVDIFFDEFEQFLRAMRKYGTIDNDLLTEVELALIERISDKYFSLKNDYV
jgi:hypothetical protein